MHGSMVRPELWLLFHNPKFGIPVKWLRLTLPSKRVLGNANGIVPVFTAQHHVRHLAFAGILFDHVSRILVLAQSDKLRMSQPNRLRPF